jgi:hypothetical protein
MNVRVIDRKNHQWVPKQEKNIRPWSPSRRQVGSIALFR